jgi:hypothetical protein
MRCPIVSCILVDQELLPLRSTWIQPAFSWGSCCLCCVFHIVVCAFLLSISQYHTLHTSPCYALPLIIPNTTTITKYVCTNDIWNALKAGWSINRNLFFFPTLASLCSWLFVMLSLRLIDAILGSQVSSTTQN